VVFGPGGPEIKILDSLLCRLFIIALLGLVSFDAGKS